MHQILPFKPAPLLKSGYLQTIFGSFGLPLAAPPSKQLIVDVSDGDRLCCEVSTPKNWTPQDATIVMLPGLGGSHRSRYMVRLSRRLYHLGRRVIRVNMRGCGSGEALAYYPFHGGMSADLFRVLEEVKQAAPDSPITLAGFSLGGNISLKLLGELGEEGQRFLRKAVTVCPSIELYKSAERLSHPENRLFEKHYVCALMWLLKRKKELFPRHPIPAFPKHMSLYQFDDIYTAPMSGFQSANDYYARASSSKYLKSIEVPTKLLFAADDPFVPREQFDNAEYSPFVTTYETRYGGHMAFLGWAGMEYKLRWMDRQVMEWIT